MRDDLRLIPFFSELQDDVLVAIEQRCQREHIAKGELVFAEGDYGDRMFVIQSGQVKVVSERNGTERIFAFLNEGNFFGEMALLTGEPRSASVRVVIDAELISLSKQDLEYLINQYPVIAVEISRELSRRLTRQNRQAERPSSPGLLTVVGQTAPELARQLAAVTGEEVFLLDLGGLADIQLNQAELAQANVQFARGAPNITADELPLRASALVQEYFWVLLAVPLYPSLLTIKAIDLAEVTIHLADKPEAWLAQAAARAYWRIPPQPKRIGRLARQLGGRLVGLGLSSGGARGLAHIGVLQVLEQAGIPVDRVSAASMGAIVGGMYCAGRSFDDMHQIAALMARQTNFLTGITMWDISLPPRSGLLRGNKTLDYFRKILDNKRFEELDTPLSIIACDVISGEEVVFETGPVADAVRASMSIIGVFEPAHIDDHFLVDGGAVNPIPTSVLCDHGVDIVVASNVIPSLQDRVHRKQQMQLGRAPNVAQILLGAMEIMESEIIKTRVKAVDVMIAADVARFSTLDYDRADEIIEVGRQAARCAVPQLKQLLAPRPRPRPA